MEERLSAMGLVWVGLGGIIGAAFFLASGLAISYAGPGVAFAYLLGGLLTSQVAGALMALSVDHPVRGSFKVYAEEILGPFMGFYLGWTFWISAILAMGSEIIAMAIFSRLWFPSAPIWLLALVYSGIVITLNAFGLKGFGKVESIMSLAKVSALVLFIIVGIIAVFGGFATTQPVGIKTLLGYGGLFPHGLGGVFRSMLIVVFAYSGISVVALASSEVREPKRDIPKAIYAVLVVLNIVYVGAILAVVSLIPWNKVSASQSPFVTALESIHVPIAPSIMNAVILVAAFSVMAGTYFSAIMMLVSLGNAHQAPAFVARRSENGVFYGSLVLTTVGLVAIIVASYILPGRIYAYLTSASAYFAFLNLGTILLCFLLWRRTAANQELLRSPLTFGAPWTTVITLGIILVLFLFSLGVADQRMGFYFALGISVIVAVAYLLSRRGHEDRSQRELNRQHSGS